MTWIGTHLKCANENVLLFAGIVQRWEVLQAQAVERQRQSGQVRELQRQVKSLRVVLESLIERANDTTQVKDLETHHQLSDKLQELKVSTRVSAFYELYIRGYSFSGGGLQYVWL